MGYLPRNIIEGMGFKYLGRNVKISDKAAIYNPDKIEIGDDSRIDDFCIISGNVKIGRYSHITPMCLVAGGEPGVYMSDFCTLAYGVKVFSQSDDYSGESMTNSLIPRQFKHEKFATVLLGSHVIVGAGSIIFPGVAIEDGCSIGALTLVNKSTTPWGVYTGIPARRVKERKKDLLALAEKFLEVVSK